MRKTALAEDITLGQGRGSVPKDYGALLIWVQDPKNLDKVADSFRRTCSGYVSTARLFAVTSGPLYLDWPAVLSIMEAAEGCINRALAFIDIGQKGKLKAQAEALEEARELVHKVAADLPAD